MTEMVGSTPVAAIWDDVENGPYAADFRLWEELADGRDPVLDLGCGAGRVALHLAREGREVWALDLQEELIATLRERAADEGLEVRAEAGDMRDFDLGTSFGLIAAPMQLVQLMRGPEERASMMAAVRRHLAPGGLFAAAVMDPPIVWGEADENTLPDVRERDVWVFQSMPLGIRVEGPELIIERQRQIVSPEGEMSETRHEDRLDVLEADRLEAEAKAAGFALAGRRPVEPTEQYVGSVVVLLEQGGDGA